MKKLYALFVSCLILISVAFPASAAENDISLEGHYHETESARIQRVLDAEDPDAYLGLVEENFPITPGIIPYVTCTNCFKLTYSVCAAEATFMGSRTHNYGLFWSKECKISFFESRGAEICPSCLNVNEMYAAHPCWEVHDSCSKGTIDLCPMQVS